MVEACFSLAFLPKESFLKTLCSTARGAMFGMTSGLLESSKITGVGKSEGGKLLWKRRLLIRESLSRSNKVSVKVCAQRSFISLLDFSLT